MKTLHLLRHAKSAWDEPGLSDRERGLNARGRRDAPRMGAALSRFLPPQVLTVSPARRAQLTLAGLCAGWPGLDALEHGTEEALYTFDSADLLDWLQAQGAGPPSLFLLGHNPALTDLVNTLVGAQALANLPTAGYVCLEIPVDRWARLGEQPARLVRQLFPKMLPRD